MRSRPRLTAWREAGYEVIGLRRGYAALLHIIPFHGVDNSAWVLP